MDLLRPRNMQNAAQIAKVPPDAVEFGFINQMQDWSSGFNLLPISEDKYI